MKKLTHVQDRIMKRAERGGDGSSPRKIALPSKPAGTSRPRPFQESALTHLDARGEARMVDVSAKPVLRREAVACGEIRLQATTIKLIESQAVAKGNVLAAAR